MGPAAGAAGALSAGKPIRPMRPEQHRPEPRLLSRLPLACSPALPLPHPRSNAHLYRLVVGALPRLWLGVRGDLVLQLGACALAGPGMLVAASPTLPCFLAACMP